MKVVLLDENLPHNLRHDLPGHDVTTMFYRGWSGRKNGELIALCAAHGIDVIITADQGIACQQNFFSGWRKLYCRPLIKPFLVAFGF